MPSILFKAYNGNRGKTMVGPTPVENWNSKLGKLNISWETIRNSLLFIFFLIQSWEISVGFNLHSPFCQNMQYIIHFFLLKWHSFFGSKSFHTKSSRKSFSRHYFFFQSNNFRLFANAFVKFHTLQRQQFSECPSGPFIFTPF